MPSQLSAEVKQDRDQLFADETSDVKKKSRRRKKSSSSSRKNTSNSTMNEAAEIGQSLQRTQTLLAQELHRVSNVATAIDDDGKMLQDTMEQHQSLGVKKSAQALTSLQRAKQQEHRILMLSLAFFWTVFFYIVWCRILLHIPFVDKLIPSLHRLGGFVKELF